MGWIGANTELLGVILATIGILLSLYTVQRGRAGARLDAFSRIHEQLLDPEIQYGRQLLLKVRGPADVPPVGSPEWRAINQAVTAYHTLALYAERRVIDRGLALEAWHHSLRDAGPSVQIFAAARACLSPRMWQPWPELLRLFRRAEQHRSRSGCCPEPVSDAGYRTRRIARAGIARLTRLWRSVQARLLHSLR
jgi:hypothetical protein